MSSRLPTWLEKVSILSRTAVSDVYLVRRDGALLVAKVPCDQSACRRARLREEYELLEKFASSRIIRPVAFVDEPLWCGLLLEWNESFAPLSGFGPLPLEQWLRAGVQMCESLAEVHAQGLVHRDVKPGNFLASEGVGRVMLLDFGHCRATGGERGPDGDTLGMAGTPAYVAPEQTGRLGWGVDARADLYSLGVSLFELMAGELPFPGKDLLELAHAHIAKDPPALTSPLCRVPEVVETIVRRLLAKSPDARYQTARGLAADLRRCVERYNGRTIASFTLGQEDGRRVFHIPEALYGRRAETDALLAAYREACGGRPRVVFVAGESGVGKSKLIATVRGVARGAVSISGKPDQFERNHPFAAMVAALGGWADSISGADEACIQRWRRRLNKAVGVNGQLVVDLVPKFDWLLGEQAEVQEAAVEQAEARLLEVLVRLVKSLAADGPLMVFLDDLQWADLATLGLVRRLATDCGDAPILVVCSYRDDEVQQGHPLTQVLRDLSEGQRGVETVRLGPLSRFHVTEFVKGALGGGVDSPALVDLVFERSEGNPFYLAQLLTSFHDAGAIRPDPDTGGWYWDAAGARCLPAHDGVVDLLIARFSRLSEQCRATLAVAAVLGARFDVATLATACSRAPEAVGRDLWPALETGYLRPSLGLHRAKDRLIDPETAAAVELGFAHDRIQEAAKLLLGPREAEVRCGLGFELVSRLSADALEARLFEVVDHCNFLDDPSESPQRRRLAELNLEAARRAFHSLAIEAASRYCGQGRRFLGPEPWTDDRGLAFALVTLQAKCEYVCERHDAGLGLLMEARGHDLSPSWQATTLMIEGAAMSQSGDTRLAVDKFAEAMDCLGLSVSRHPSALRVAAELARTKWALRGRSFEQLVDLPSPTDPVVRQQIEVLMSALPAAFTGGDKAFHVFAACVLARLVLRHGADARSAPAFSSLAIVYHVALQDYATGEFLGRVAREMARGDAQAMCRTKLLYANFSSYWTPQTPSDRVQMLTEAYESGVEAGDLEHATYCLLHIAASGFASDPSLARHLERCEAARAASKRAGNRHGAVCEYLLRRARCVAGKDPLPTVDEIAQAASVSPPAAGVVFASVALELGLLLGDRKLRCFGFDLALEHDRSTRGADLNISSTVAACLHACRVESDDPDRKRCRHYARRALKRVRRWARSCPETFLGLDHWLHGEFALSDGSPHAALKSLRRALDLEFNTISRRAAILETIARAERAVGNGHQARVLLAQACEAYRVWGAVTKVDQLVADHADIELRFSTNGAEDGSTTSAESILDSSLDFDAVFKSAQALSSEVVLKSLLQKMLRTVLESTGGQRAAVLEPGSDGWVLSVWGEASQQDIGTELGPPDPETVPLSILASVSRMREPVMISDATHHEVWAEDPAVVAQGIRSILCVPVVRQRHLDAVVYVDHLSVARCFPASRARVLLMLASQISISLENARLYATLENKVEERTEALREVSENLHTILDHVKFGFLVVGADLKVRPGFSRSCELLLGTRDISGRAVCNVLGATDPRESHAIEFSCQQIFDDVLPQELYREQFPGRQVRGSRVLQVEPSAVRHKGEVAAILLTIVDNTELEAAQKQNTTNRVLLNLLRRKDAFLMFLRDCQRMLDEGAQAARRDDRQQVARCMHTLKGTVGLFGLSDVEQFIHELENRPKVDVADVLAVRATLQTFLDRHRDLLGVGLDGGDEPDASVPHSALAELDRLASRLGRAEAGELRRWTSCARSPSVRDIMGPLVQSMTQLAVQLHKEVEIIVEGGQARIVDAEAQAVLRSLVLLFRNSIDHGIEMPMDRGDKPSRAQVRLRVSVTADGYEFVVEDDGRGIDVDAVTRAALAAGAVSEADAVEMTESECLQLIFIDRLSTAKKLSVISGRGVGMSALRDKIVELGGEIAVKSRLGRGTTITISLPHVEFARRVA